VTLTSGLLFTQLSQASATIRYITPGGSDLANNCTSSASPCATLQHAVDVAGAGDSLRVAAGTYADITAVNGITQVVYLDRDLAISGGYTANFNAPPDPAANPTILDAGGNGRVVTILTATVSLNGLHLTGGDAALLNRHGGGLYAQNSTLYLQQLTIISNTAELGGGLFVQASSGVVQDSFITQNRADYGGGLYLQSSDLQVQDNIISQNEADFGGGGLRLFASDAVVTGNEVADNTAVLQGGGLYLSFSDATVSQNLISYNRSTTPLQSWGGGLQLHASQSTLIGNTIADNEAGSGGGLRLFQSSATLQANTFRHNVARVGGGISVESASDAVLENTAFVLNNSSESGAALYVFDAHPQLTHTTLTDNSGGDGSGVYVGKYGRLTLLNSLIVSHSIGILNSGGAVTLTTTLWDGNTQSTTGVVSETGSFTGTSGLAADGVHLLPISEARDSGLPSAVTSDIDGQARPHHGGPDLGADEWWGVLAQKHVSQQVVQPGQTIDYSIGVQNTMTGTITAVVTDVLPSEVTFVGPLTFTSGSGIYANGTITWTGTLAFQQAVTITWPVQVDAALPLGTVVTNTAVIYDSISEFPTNPAVFTSGNRVYLPFVAR
jgi:uncharacterized repeat protein (TIGR01451 family)